MKAILALLLLLARSALAHELQLSVIANNATHREAWHIAQEAMRRAGIAVVAREVPAERALVSAKSGVTDGDVARFEAVGRLYPELVRVPEPSLYYQAYAYAYRRFDVSAGWDSLRGRTICLRRGIKLYEMRTAGMSRQVLDDERSLLRMLRSGGCEVALLEDNNPDVRAAMAASPPLYRLTPQLEGAPLYIYLHKRHAALVPRIAQALRQMRADGTLQRMPTN
jgi:polar amino acid transport system substrate-binding protein